MPRSPSSEPGTGGCAAAGDLGRRGLGVRLWSRSDRTLADVRRRGGIELSGEPGELFVPVPVVTSDLDEAVRGAGVVMLCVPTQAHGENRRSPRPACLEPGQIVLATPGHTVLLIPNALRANGLVRPVVAETATLPYICRMVGPGRVRVGKTARALPFAVFPGREMERVRPLIERFLPAVRPVKNILATVFPYGNAIHHPPATLCNAGRIEATRGDYYHYYDGITPSVGRLIDTLDGERRAVGAALGVDVVPFVENFFRMGYTTEAARGRRNRLRGVPPERAGPHDPRPRIPRPSVPRRGHSRSAWCRCRSWDASPACPRRRWTT